MSLGNFFGALFSLPRKTGCSFENALRFHPWLSNRAGIGPWPQQTPMQSMKNCLGKQPLWIHVCCLWSENGPPTTILAAAEAMDRGRFSNPTIQPYRSCIWMPFPWIAPLEWLWIVCVWPFFGFRWSLPLLVPSIWPWREVPGEPHSFRRYNSECTDSRCNL